MRLISGDARRTPQGAELVLICAALAGVVGSLFAIAWLSMDLLSAARGYTQGEALWSKGQKDAVVSLSNYAHTLAESDYQEFRNAISVPLACRKVRLQLEQPQYDRAVVTRDMLDAGIHPADHDRMIRLFRRFNWVPQLARAISIWAEGDREIATLLKIGENLHRRVRSGAADPELIPQTLAELGSINRRLTPLEARFSQSLAEAGRWLHNLLVSILAVAATLLILAASLVYSRLLRRITDSEHKHRHLIDTASEAIFVADGRTGRILDVNRKAAELLGLARVEELAGTVLPLLDLKSGSNDNTLVARLQNIVGSKRETKLQSANGAWIVVEFSASVVTVRGGPLIEFIVRDVTEQKRSAKMIRDSEQRYRRLSEEFLAARDAALEASRAKSRFLANMSHEIRTPMNGVMGMLEIVQDSTLSPEQHEHLGLAQQSATCLLGILNDILDLSKIEAGRVELEVREFSLREGVESALNMLAVQADEKGLELCCDIAVEAPELIRGDETRVRQILINLIGNAIKFTAAGRVQVGAAVESRDAEHITLRFTVSDTGIGIQEEKQKVIFDSFAQADTSTTRKFGGTGLGLTISASLVRMMGGRIWVESTPQQGSQFHFTAEFETPQQPGTIPEGNNLASVGA